jgi:5-methylcytosine-specific restriction protein A
MPTAALRPCRVCKVVGCTVHAKKGDFDHASPRPRLRGRRLQRAREALFADDPFCAICRRRLASVRDHIRPVAEGGTEEPANIQGLCSTCNRIKTAQEAARGASRAR